MSKDKKRKERRAHEHDTRMYITTITVKCQNTPETFNIEVHREEVHKTCWCCNKETFVVIPKPGRNNLEVRYYDANGGMRVLEPIHPDVELGVAQYWEEKGMYIIQDQHLP